MDDVLKYKNIITSIPITRDKIYLNFQYSDLKIKIETFLKQLKDKFLISGALSKEDKDILLKNNNNFLDILEDDTYTILNARITAEGIIKLAIENSDKSLYDSKILILGYGRIGKNLCNILKVFSQNIYCMSNRKEELEWININGIYAVSLNLIEKILDEFDIIINTIPCVILDKDKLRYVKNDVTIIDVSSKPGGIDFEYAKKNKIKVVWELGIPGKISPITCAEKIKKIIYEKNVT